MIILDWAQWWYGAGLRRRVQLLGRRIGKAVDFFSISLLLKTLFAPFRQISAEKSHSAGLETRARMVVDRMVSRLIGGAMRIFVILAGLVVLAVLAVWSILVLACHVLRPVLVVVCVVLFCMGWALLKNVEWLQNVKF